MIKKIFNLFFLLLALLTKHRRRALWILKRDYSLGLPKRSRAGYILLISYLALGLNIIFRELEFYSIEWSFIVFILSMIAFIIYKIDTRFLIFPAILLLGYAPFLLIAKQDILAENIAIYAYYFLVVGVIGQFIEYTKGTRNSLDFGKSLSSLSRNLPSFRLMAFFGILTLTAFLIDIFFQVIRKWKYSITYIFILFLITYLISLLRKQNV